MGSVFKILPTQRIQQTMEDPHSQSNEKRMEAIVSMKAQRKSQIAFIHHPSVLRSGVYNCYGMEEESKNCSYDCMV